MAFFGNVRPMEPIINISGCPVGTDVGFKDHGGFSVTANRWVVVVMTNAQPEFMLGDLQHQPNSNCRPGWQS